MRRLTLCLLALALALVMAPATRAYYSGTLNPNNPLAGHPWYVDKTRGSWWVAMRSDRRDAAILRKAADNPMGKTFGSWYHDPRAGVRGYILRALKEEPGSIPFINLARIEGKSCPYGPTPPGFSESDVDRWVKGFSAGIGRYRVLVIVETDKLTTIRCLPAWAQARRFRELRYEVHLMHERNPNAIVYIDAGARDWGKKAPTIARWLRRADVSEARGFALNASHHDWTSREVAFGLAIARLLHGKHFVVNTSSNAWGPKPRFYSSSYHIGCDPPGEGLGIRPTVKTPNPLVDAFLWLGTPGYDGGQCLGYGHNAPYQFWVKLAVSLVEHAKPTL